MTDVLLRGDCLELMPQIPDNSVSLVLCDLPYGITNCDWDRRIDLAALWEQYKRVVEPCGMIALFAQQPFTTDLINSKREWFKYEWTWPKRKNAGALAVKFRPMSSHESVVVFQKQPAPRASDVPGFAEILRYLCGEYAKAGLNGARLTEITGTSTAARHYFEDSQWMLPTAEHYAKLRAATGAFLRDYGGLRRAYYGGDGLAAHYHPPGVVPYTGTSKRHRGRVCECYGVRQDGQPHKTTGNPPSVLRFASPDVMGVRFHPTQKPVDLLEFLIRTYTNEGDLVLDNCMGSGSTCVAAVNTNRHYIGIEKDDRYYQIACQRVEKAKNADRQMELEEQPC